MVPAPRRLLQRLETEPQLGLNESHLVDAGGAHEFFVPRNQLGTDMPTNGAVRFVANLGDAAQANALTVACRQVVATAAQRALRIDFEHGDVPVDEAEVEEIARMQPQHLAELRRNDHTAKLIDLPGCADFPGVVVGG